MTAVYAWPLGQDSLRATSPAAWDFTGASAEAERVVTGDVTDPRVVPQCRSSVRTHGARTAKAVLLLHGYTDCPKQLDLFADYLFDRGYNVYVPRAPRHGFTLGDVEPGLSADELTAYADRAMNVVAGLGQEAGVVGISGGAVLATWLAERRPDAVTRLMVMSPFYRPAASQAPSFLVKPLTVLYGHRLLPDRSIPGTGQTYSELTQYLRITGNIDGKAVNDKLRTAAIVVAEGDDQIDRQAAVDLITRLAGVNGITPGKQILDGSIGHDVVEPTAPGVTGNTDALYADYLSLYES